MFKLFFDETNRVLITRLDGVLKLDGILASNAAGLRFVAGQTEPISLIVDFSAVDSIDIGNNEMRMLARAAESTRITTRIYVMPDSTQFGMGRLFSAYQGDVRRNVPKVVRTRAEADEALGLVSPQFIEVTA